MKKLLLIGLSLLFIMSCDEDKALVAEELSIIGTWTLVSITEYDNLTCTGDGGTTTDETGTIEFTETSATLTLTESYSFIDYCEEWDGELTLSDGDTSCAVENEGTFDLEDFGYNCENYGFTYDGNTGTLVGLNCNQTWIETFDFTFDMETMEYCELYEEWDGYISTDCGTAELTENSLTITMSWSDEDEDEEGCDIFVLSR